MSKDNDFPHHISCSDKFKKKVDRIAALLELDSWHVALAVAVDLALAHAEASVKGYTRVVSCTPNLAELIESNPKFIETLCEEGVVEWLTPLVLTKTHNNKSNANA